jgi:Fe-S oxidoreductase
MVRILQAAEVRFGILGREERCCGDPARRLGDEALFQRLAGANMAAFRKYEVRHMVCLCPHGFNTFRNEYGALDLGRDLAVSHAVPFVLELIRAGRISLRYPIQGTIAIQDPCYLSRANGIVEPLRGILNCIPDMNIRELEHTGEQALCCGGGGGRMWLHETAETPVNRVRAREVAAAGADILATACPFCHTMMSDGIGSLETDRPPRVADILELIDAALGRRY